MNTLTRLSKKSVAVQPVAKRAQILSLLCEGTSMRAVSQLADISINTG